MTRYTIDASFTEHRMNGLPLFVLGELMQSKTDEKGATVFFEEDALNDFTDRMLADPDALSALTGLIGSQAQHNRALAKAFDVEAKAFPPNPTGVVRNVEISAEDMETWRRFYVESGLGLEHNPEALMIAALTDLSDGGLQLPFGLSIARPDGSGRGMVFFGGTVTGFATGAEAIESARERNRIRTENRSLVVSYLAHQGKHNEAIPIEHQMEVYTLADGFGYLDAATLSEINDGWDWSHVRDSTEEGWQRMADWLREHGYGPDGPSAAPRP